MESFDQSIKNKLIILHTLKNVSFPLTNIQLMKIVIENKFMDYFSYQNALKDLEDKQLINKSQNEHITTYIINSSGETSLASFNSQIPLDIENFLNANISKIKTELRENNFVQSKIIEEDNSFIVNCTVKEADSNLLELNITVGSRENAQKISNNWKANPQQIYSEIIKTLTLKR